MSVNACLKLSVSKVRATPQRGAVLIMALLIVSVVAGLAVKFTGDFQLGLARAESRWHGAQARSLLLSAENVAAFLLSQDDPAVDYLGEGWDQELPFQIDGADILASAEDLSGRLNLNNLGMGFTANKGYNDWDRFNTNQRRFIRLLQAFPNEVPLNEGEAIAILEAIIDWRDADNQQTGFNGAEADYYQSLDPAYLPANNSFESLEELRLVRHMTPELMTLLENYLVVLPEGRGSLNINTLPDKLLASIADQQRLQPLSEMDVELLRQPWDPRGFYEQVSDFTGSTAWQSIGGSTPDTSGLDVKTNFFRVTLQVQLVQQRRIMQSILERNPSDNTFSVFRRKDSY